MKKSKPNLYSDADFLIINLNEIGKSSASSSIERNFHLLHFHFFDIYIDVEKYSDLKDKIRSRIGSTILVSELMQEWDTEEKNDYTELNALLRKAKHAYCYLELAKAAEQHGETNRAWAFNTHAAMTIGEIISTSETVQENLRLVELSKKNSANGRARVNNFTPVKQEVVRLLETMRPESGWESAMQTARSLKKPLAEFVGNKFAGLSSSNIENLLAKKWIPEDPIVNEAWEKYRRPKASKLPKLASHR